MSAEMMAFSFMEYTLRSLKCSAINVTSKHGNSRGLAVCICRMVSSVGTGISYSGSGAQTHTESVGGMFSRSTPASSFPASKNPLVFTAANTNHYKITWLSCLLCSRECHICCSDALKGSSSLPAVTHFYTTFHVLGYSLISSAEKRDT